MWATVGSALDFDLHHLLTVAPKCDVMYVSRVDGTVDRIRITSII